MNTTNMHFVVQYPDTYPTILIENELKPIKNLGYEVGLREMESMGMMAALDWAIPTGFVVYLLKPYFETFLTEAAKDHYSFIKEKITEFIVQKRRIKTTVVVASNSPNKVNKDYDQSRTISVKVIYAQGISVTILLNETVSEPVLTEALKSLLDELIKVYKENHEDIVENGEPSKHDKFLELFMIMDTDNKTWKLLTFNEMLDKYRVN